MPLLEYRCSNCGKKTENLVLAGEQARPPKCPACGSKKMARLLSTFAAQSSSSTPSNGGFDAATACGGGACGMPEGCGAGRGFEEN